MFKLSRIRQLRVDMEVFPRRPERLEDLDTKWGQRGARSFITMVLRFHPRVRVRVEEYFGPEQLLVRSEHPADVWLYGMILSYGPHVQVLEPKSLAEEISGQARRIVELYT